MVRMHHNAMLTVGRYLFSRPSFQRKSNATKDVLRKSPSSPSGSVCDGWLAMTPGSELMSGANDSVLPARLQHVPLDRYKANLAKLIHFVKDPSSPWYSPDTRIVLITAPPIIPEDWLKHCEGMWKQNGSQGPKPTEIDREPKNTKRYVEACLEVAKQEQVQVVDAWSAIVDKAGGSDASSLAPYF